MTNWFTQRLLQKYLTTVRALSFFWLICRTPEMKLCVLSLFDGVSCAQLALQQLGVTDVTYFASEIDDDAIRITQQHFPRTTQLGDVRGVSAATVAPRVDLLVGGSPCQGLSFSGKKRLLQDSRSTLFFEFVRILRDVKPRYFLFENVMMPKSARGVITEALGVEPVCVSSGAVSAQLRTRLYWTNIPQREALPIDERRWRVLGDVTGVDVSPGDRVESIERHQVYSRPMQNGFACHPHGKCHTVYSLRGPKVVCPTDPRGWRPLTADECEQLQCMPRGYTGSFGYSHQRRIKLIGNAMTVDVISHLIAPVLSDAESSGTGGSALAAPN